MTKKQKELIIVIFGGPFGVHKFIDGNIKMGIVYLFTFGLFGIGWFIDIIKILLSGRISNYSDSLMGGLEIQAINDGKIPNIQGTNLNLANGETCCYMDKAYTFKDKTITTGYTGKRNGVSIKIAKGVSYHTGGSGSQAIRKTQRTTYDGILYLTTKRIIYTSPKESFDKTFDKITSIQEASDGLIIQIGSNTYSIITKTHSEFMKVFNLLKQLENTNTNNKISSNGKEILYEKLIKITHTNTDGRQKLIKQLIKNDNKIKNQEYFQEDLICCEADIEDGEMPSGKKCINVIVKREGSKYPYHLGYIPEELKEELHTEVAKADGYSVDIYVSTEDDGKYSLKLKIKFYKI